MPVLLFYNVATANIFEVFNAKLIIYICACACLICALLFIVVPLAVKDPKRRGVMIQGTFRSNFLLFGVPLGLKFGSMLRNVKFSIFSVLGKIVLIPAVMLTLSALIGFDKLEMAILVAVFATPNAVSSYAMARNYNADHDLAGEIITLGTLLSIFTMFVFITVARSFGWI